MKAIKISIEGFEEIFLSCSHRETCVEDYTPFCFFFFFFWSETTSKETELQKQHDSCTNRVLIEERFGPDTQYGSICMDKPKKV